MSFVQCVPIALTPTFKSVCYYYYIRLTAFFPGQPG